MFRWSPSTQTRACLTTFLLLLFLVEGQAYGASREQLIPVLGVTTGQNQIGTVSYCAGLIRRAARSARPDAALPHGTRPILTHGPDFNRTGDQTERAIPGNLHRLLDGRALSPLCRHDNLRGQCVGDGEPQRRGHGTGQSSAHRLCADGNGDSRW